MHRLHCLHSAGLHFLRRRLAPPPRRNITRCANANADGEMEHPKYCESYVESRRRPTHTVWIGKVPVGSEHPLALQTMTTTNTRDVEATVTQCKKVADAGADIVRITVQGMKEAEACMEIKNKLVADGYDIPLVADIHFAPKVALKVAEAVDKVWIRPPCRCNCTACKIIWSVYLEQAVFTNHRRCPRWGGVPLGDKVEDRCTTVASRANTPPTKYDHEKFLLLYPQIKDFLILYTHTSKKQ